MQHVLNFFKSIAAAISPRAKKAWRRAETPVHYVAVAIFIVVATLTAIVVVGGGIAELANGSETYTTTASDGTLATFTFIWLASFLGSGILADATD